MTALFIKYFANPSRMANSSTILPRPCKPARLPGATAIRRFSVVLVTLLLAAFARADEYDTLRLKWFDSLVGTGYDTQDPVVISKLNSIASSANSNWSSISEGA